MSEFGTIIAICLLIVIVVGFAIYKNKKHNDVKSNAVASFTVIAINVLADYISEHGKTDAKKFDEFSDYIIYVKDYLFGEIFNLIKNDSSMDEKIKKILMNDDTINDILDTIIIEETEFLNDTFVSTMKKSKKSKSENEDS